MTGGRESPPSGDCATVTVFVHVSPEDAFDVFTREIDRWWQKGPRYRIAGRRPGRLCFEPGPDGRLFETFEGASGTRTFEMGRILRESAPSEIVRSFHPPLYERYR